MVYDPIRHRNRGGYLYLASLEISAAFDTVPHSCLLSAAAGGGPDSYLLRSQSVWLRETRFRTRLATPTGRFACEGWPVTSGLRPGRAPYPLLWLLHFNDVHTVVRYEIWGRGEDIRQIGKLDSYLADDTASAIAHENPALLAEAANPLADNVRERLLHEGLNIRAPKSLNIAASPGGMTVGASRQTGGPPKTRDTEIPKKADLIARRVPAASNDVSPSLSPSAKV